MNMVSYVVEYEYAAMGLIAVLVLIFCARRKYPGMSNRIYAGMLICTFFSSLTHVFAMKSLPVASSLPLWLNYVIHISYLLFYDFEAILYMMYVIALTKRNKMSKASSVFTLSLIGAETLLLVTTPFTKLIIYFNDNMEYCHGPLFYVYPVIALMLMMFGSFMFVKYRRKSEIIQAASMLFFFVVTVAATVVQLLLPQQVMGNYAIALVLVMFLIIIQNPDDFTDKAADCFNDEAFFNSVEVRIDESKPFTIAAFRFDGLNYINGLFSVGERSAAPRAVAAKLMSGFGTGEVYHLGGCEFAMFTNEKRKITEKYLADRILSIFSKPVKIHGIEANLTPKICVVRYPDFAQSAEDVRDAIEYTLRTTEKAEGSVFVASKESITAKKREMHILSTIKNCIVNKSFEMYYQPIYEPAEHGFVCSEALISQNEGPGAWIRQPRGVHTTGGIQRHDNRDRRDRVPQGVRVHEERAGAGSRREVHRGEPVGSPVRAGTAFRPPYGNNGGVRNTSRGDKFRDNRDGRPRKLRRAAEEHELPDLKGRYILHGRLRHGVLHCKLPDNPDDGYC